MDTKLTNQAPPVAPATRNPYRNRGPIRDAHDFCGRAGVVNTALSLLDNAQCLSLVGARRIGKTSLLHHISDPCVLKAQGYDAQQYVFVFRNTSCEQLGELDRKQILRAMLANAREAIGNAQMPNGVGGELPPVETFFDFTAELRKLAKGTGKLVFLFDEFEYLAQNPRLNPAFFAGLRSIAGSIPGSMSVAYVTTSASNLLNITYADASVLGSPFFNIFSTLKIGLFDDDEVLELIQKPSQASGLKFSGETVQFIRNLADHHPFFVQIACFHAFEMQSQKGKLTQPDYPILREDIDVELQSHLEYAWRHLTEEAKQVLMSLESAGEDPRNRQILDYLNDQGVLCRRGEQFRLCKLWDQFVKTQVSKWPGPPEHRSPGEIPPGPLPPPRLSDPATSHLREPLRIKLQITHPKGVRLEVRSLESPGMGQLRGSGRLPYSMTDLPVVLALLEHSSSFAERSSPAQAEALQRLALLHGRHLVENWRQKVGIDLHHALFPGEVCLVATATMNQARRENKTITLQLCFDSNAVELARYPWELVHDGRRHLCSSGAMEIVRYIMYPEPPAAMRAAPPWRLLYVAPRPRDLSVLPGQDERNAVWAGLQSVVQTGKLALDQLQVATYDAFVERLDSADYDLIHFDGHGAFARRCSQCQSLNLPHVATCKRCAASLDDVQPLGYLAFEDGVGNVDLVRPSDMENALLTKRVRLVYLSACQSSVVGGGSLFGGLGPGLIQAGVPAVVAMQFSVPVADAITFAQAFYEKLALGQSVARAVAHGRKRLFRNDTWYIPTLYLRSQDDEGCLFSQSSP